MGVFCDNKTDHDQVTIVLAPGFLNLYLNCTKYCDEIQNKTDHKKSHLYFANQGNLTQFCNTPMLSYLFGC